jgi:NAD(P)H-dependent FMN reductase
MKKRIAAISGSLKKTSANTAVLQALKNLADDNAEVVIYDGLDRLPFFSPELDTESVASSVKHWREYLRSADGFIISTPEYAFGVPGVLKNALDWVVGSGEFYQKPVVTISASTTPLGGDKAHASLRLTLTAMGTNLSEKGKLIIPGVKTKIDSQGNIIDPVLSSELKELFDFLINTL